MKFMVSNSKSSAHLNDYDLTFCYLVQLLVCYKGPFPILNLQDFVLCRFVYCGFVSKILHILRYFPYLFCFTVIFGQVSIQSCYNLKYCILILQLHLPLSNALEKQCLFYKNSRVPP